MAHKIIATLGQRAYRMVTLLFLAACIVIAVACFAYYNRLQDTVTNESSSYMQEIAHQIGANVSRTIEDNFSVLGTITNLLKHANVNTYEKLQPIVREQQSHWNYKKIFLIDEMGVAYDAYGEVVSLASDEYLSSAVVGRQRAMSAAQVVNGEECIVFAIPVDGLNVGGIRVSALAASYDTATFDRILAMSAFDGQGYCTVNQRDGTVVVRSSVSGALHSGENTLDTLATVQMNKEGDLDTVRTHMEQGQPGMVGFTVDGIHTYMSYVPLDTNEWCLLTFVPVEVVNSRSQLLMNLTLWMCAVITGTFALLLAALMVTSYRHGRKLAQIAYVDPVTKGNTLQRFLALADVLLHSSGRPEYALIYSNIEKFKVLNAQYGREACDELLRSLWDGAEQDLAGHECMGRISGDNYCFLVVWEGAAALKTRVQRWYDNAVRRHETLDAVWVEPIIEVGVYPIEEESMPFSHMIDRAKLALRVGAQDLRRQVRFGIYDDEIGRSLFREKQLEDMMERALRDGEFQVYLQPKYRTDSEEIGGAEALVRWKSFSEGMIFPDEFIPLFEKNGFIVQVDRYVFEVVCRAIRRWLDAGVTPVKVSVNCSKVNLWDAEFLVRYQEICAKWGVSPSYIEVELTENLVFGNVERLAQIIEDIHRAGFGCSMDDFGSGYSSLNMIQDIPVDTIKLDRVFFRAAGRAQNRTELVVGCILTMTKALNMITVAEGVEDLQQVEMLRRLGCDFIQGYYYAKPMPIPEFEVQAFGREIEEGQV